MTMGRTARTADRSTRLGSYGCQYTLWCLFGMARVVGGHRRFVFLSALEAFTFDDVMKRRRDDATTGVFINGVGRARGTFAGFCGWVGILAFLFRSLTCCFLAFRQFGFLEFDVRFPTFRQFDILHFGIPTFRHSDFFTDVQSSSVLDILRLALRSLGRFYILVPWTIHAIRSFGPRHICLFSTPFFPSVPSFRFSPFLFLFFFCSRNIRTTLPPPFDSPDTLVSSWGGRRGVFGICANWSFGKICTRSFLSCFTGPGKGLLGVFFSCLILRGG